MRLSWEPFHAALAALVAETRARFGLCLLIDCATPCQAARRTRRSRRISCWAMPMARPCAPRATRAASHPARPRLRVQRNDPMPAASSPAITAARASSHAIQIEIARRLYMDEANIERSEPSAASSARSGGDGRPALRGLGRVVARRAIARLSRGAAARSRARAGGDHRAGHSGAASRAHSASVKGSRRASASRASSTSTTGRPAQRSARMASMGHRAAARPRRP